jgi:hypothetical protein
VMGIMPGEQLRKPRPLHQTQLGDLAWQLKISR